MTPIITLPANFIASTTEYVGQLFSDLTPVIVLLVGLAIAFYVVSKVIGLMRSGLRTRRA